MKSQDSSPDKPGEAKMTADTSQEHARREDGPAPGGRIRRLNSTMAEGLANGFFEASIAFSDEVQGSSSYSDFIEGLAAGLLRANGRFLAELGTTARRLSDDLAGQRIDRGAPGSGAAAIDYEELADLVASRVCAARADSAADDLAASIDYERLADLVTARLGAARQAL